MRAQLLKRCGRSIPGKRKHCVRPVGHRGVCAVRSADLERAERAAPASAQRSPAELGRTLAALAGARTADADFCELACDLGLARAAELLDRVRAATVELVRE